MALIGNTNPGKTSTVEDFISYRNDDSVSYNNFSFRDKYNNIIYPIKNIIDDYTDELKELTIDITMSDSEFLKYKYRPKVLANDVYGNPELDFLILAINGICNVKEFDSKEIKLIREDDLDNFITSVYSANKEDLDFYNSGIYSTTS